MDDRLAPPVPQHFFGRREFENVDPVQGPAVRANHCGQFFLRLGQRDVEASFAVLDALHQELQAQRRLARSWRSFQQIEAGWGQSSIEDDIQAFIAGGNAGICFHQFALENLSTGCVAPASASHLRLLQRRPDN